MSQMSTFGQKHEYLNSQIKTDGINWTGSCSFAGQTIIMRGKLPRVHIFSELGNQYHDRASIPMQILSKKIIVIKCLINSCLGEIKIFLTAKQKEILVYNFILVTPVDRRMLSGQS